MAEAVGSLRVDLQAGVAQIRGDMAAVRSIVASNANQMAASLNKMSVSSAAAMGMMRGGMQAVAAVMAGAFVRAAVEAAAEIGHLAARLGLTTDQMQVWAYAARSVGASTTDIVKVFERLNEKLGEVSEEITPTALALNKLGISAASLRKLSPDEQLKTIADRLAGIVNPAQRASVATELLGDKANDLLAIFAKGRGGVAAVADEMGRLGLILSKETIEKAQEANREFQVIETATGNAGKAMAAEFLPAVRAVRELLTDPNFAGAMKNTAWFFGNIAEGVAWALRRVVGVPELLRAAGEVGTLTQELAKAKTNLDELVAAGKPSEEALAKYEELANRLAVAQERLNKASNPQSAPLNVPDAPAPSGGGTNLFDAKKAEEIRKTTERLTFEFQRLQGEFNGLAEGLPELAFGLGIFGNEARRAYVNSGELSGRLRMLNDAQMAVNASKLNEEMRTPVQKYADEVARLNQLMSTGVLTQEAYARKALELKESLIQAGGAGVSLTNMANDMGNAFGNAMEGMILQGKSWRDAMLGFINDIAAAIVRNAVIKPLVNGITSGLGGPTGMLAGTGLFADGAAFSHGRVTAFARGGVVNGPTIFPMKNGMGLMGEAGPEAVMPLERGPDGRLGVSSRGGSGGAVYQIDARGSDAGVTDRIMRALAEVERARPDPVAQMRSYRKRFPTR